MTKHNTERGILFCGDMVRAVLEGRKTQTRRVMRPQFKVLHAQYPDGTIETERIFRGGNQRIHLPWVPDDRLWVRETFYVQEQLWRRNHFEPQPVHYAADVTPEQVEDYIKIPSIHMPRWASRLTLRVTAVRAERLQEISEADAIADGAMYHDGLGVGHSGWRMDYHDVFETAVAAYAHYWDSLNARRGYPWDSNPWVGVYAFEKEESNESRQIQE